MTDIYDSKKRLVEFLTQVTNVLDVLHKTYQAYEYVQHGKPKPELAKKDVSRPVNLSKKEHFYTATRMSPESYELLLSLMTKSLKRYANRKPIPPDTRLSVTLLYLAQGCSMEDLAWFHKLGISTVRKIIYETCHSIWEELHSVYVTSPNRTRMRRIADKFYWRTGMPNCIGAIDGKHINIMRPPKSGNLYHSYKKTYSTTLLAACDSSYTFTYVDIGIAGKQNESDVFARSNFGKKILEGTLDFPPECFLPGTQTSFPYYFVASSAYPLKQNLMRPFPGYDLPSNKANFNKKLATTRNRIENTFGVLADRWRILHTTIHALPQNADKIVLATIVLHNFLMSRKDTCYFTPDMVDHIKNGEEIEGRWRKESNPLISVSLKPSNRSSARAFNLREDLKDFLDKHR